MRLRVVSDNRAALVGLAGAVLVLFLLVGPNQASRPLMNKEARDLLKELRSSLQRAPVPPSAASGCTHVPGTNGPACPSSVNQMNFAGVHRHHHRHHSVVVSSSSSSSSGPVVVIPVGLADQQQ